MLVVKVKDQAVVLIRARLALQPQYGCSAPAWCLRPHRRLLRRQ